MENEPPVPTPRTILGTTMPGSFYRPGGIESKYKIDTDPVSGIDFVAEWKHVTRKKTAPTYVKDTPSEPIPEGLVPGNDLDNGTVMADTLDTNFDKDAIIESADETGSIPEAKIAFAGLRRARRAERRAGKANAKLEGLAIKQATLRYIGESVIKSRPYLAYGSIIEKIKATDDEGNYVWKTDDEGKPIEGTHVFVKDDDGNDKIRLKNTQYYTAPGKPKLKGEEHDQYEKRVNDPNVTRINARRMEMDRPHTLLEKGPGERLERIQRRRQRVGRAAMNRAVAFPDIVADEQTGEGKKQTRKLFYDQYDKGTGDHRERSWGERRVMGRAARKYRNNDRMAKQFYDRQFKHIVTEPSRDAKVLVDKRDRLTRKAEGLRRKVKS